MKSINLFKKSITFIFIFFIALFIYNKGINAADVSSSVNVTDFKLINDDGSEAINNGDTVKQSGYKIDVDFSINLSSGSLQNGDTAVIPFVVDLQGELWNVPTSSPVPLLDSDGNTIGNYYINANGIYLTLTDVSGKTSLSGHITTGKTGGNSMIVTKTLDYTIGNLTKSFVFEGTTLTACTAPNNNIWKSSDSRTNSRLEWDIMLADNTCGLSQDKNDASAIKYDFSNIVIEDNLGKYPIDSRGVSVDTFFYIPTSAGSTELSTKLTRPYTITSLIDGWKEVKQNTGESYAQFKARLQNNQWGQYKNDDGTYTLVIKADLSNITNEEIAQAYGYASISDMVSAYLKQRGVDANYASGLDDIYGNDNAINGRVMFLRFRFYQDYNMTVVKDTDESNTATVTVDGSDGKPITKEVTATSTLIPYIGDANVSSTSAKIVKFDKETNALLAGVQFKLQKLNGDTWEDYTANDGGDLVRTTDANGSIVFNDLNDGTYRFVEVTADEGYNINSVLYGTDVNNVNDANLTFEVNSSDATGKTIYASNQEFSYNIDYQYVGDVPSDAVVPDSDTVDYGDQYVAKDATDVDDYTFDGWYTDSSLTTKFVDGTAITGDLTLYGKYTKVETPVPNTNTTDNSTTSNSTTLPQTKNEEGSTSISSDIPQSGQSMYALIPFVIGMGLLGCTSLYYRRK
ncbi:MAG: InlB B-repeat-containing protein [Bacilli bacterium]|nr:InlB B-repeat-containing protein [Bacilli bacterium]